MEIFIAHRSRVNPFDVKMKKKYAAKKRLHPNLVSRILPKSTRKIMLPVKWSRSA
jgi:hypothetical protein